MSRRLIRLSQLATTKYSPGKLPVSPATIWRWVRDDADFPKPFKLTGGVTVWDEEAIDAFISKRAEGSR